MLLEEGLNMLESFSFFVTPFHTERTIRVYLPSNYDQSEMRYPVLYMHDGKNVFRDEEAVGGVSLGLETYLDSIGAEIIVVGIDANPTNEGRVNDYCPWVNGEYSEKIIGYRQDTGGQGAVYTDFLVNELKPQIDRKYRTHSDLNYIAGISLGGLISTFAACRYPSVFSRVAGISSGFYRNQEEIENMVRKSDLSSIERFYLDCGTAEGKGDLEASQEFVRSNQAVYDILKPKVSNLNFRIIEGDEHHYNAFRKRVPKIFSFLLS